MSTAQHHIDQQNKGGNAKGPRRVEAEHDFKHHNTRHQLARQVKEQDEGNQRDQQPHGVRLIPIAQVLGNRAVAKAVARSGNQAHRN